MISSLTPTVGPELARKLTEIAGLQQGEYQVSDATAAFQEVQQLFGFITTIISAIAGISLFVGGDWCYEHHAGFGDRAYS